jgi:hypothetical protein
LSGIAVPNRELHVRPGGATGTSHGRISRAVGTEPSRFDTKRNFFEPNRKMKIISREYFYTSN